MERDPCPNPKIIKNLCSFVCSDPAVTPSVNLSVSAATEEAPASPSPRGQTESNCNLFSGAMTTAMERGNTVQCDQYNGILLLVQQQKVLTIIPPNNRQHYEAGVFLPFTFYILGINPQREPRASIIYSVWVEFEHIFPKVIIPVFKNRHRKASL